MSDRQKTVLAEKRALFRAFHKRLAAESHELRCRIEDDLDESPRTEAHADAYDEIVSWLGNQITTLHEEIAAD